MVHSWLNNISYFNYCSIMEGKFYEQCKKIKQAMTLVYADEEAEKDGFKVFLAGPTPRTKEVKSWRPDFISLLEREGFKGNVLIAENKDERPYNCKAQTPWEVKNLQESNLIAFWIPRDLETMPGFTTNIEFGEHMRS